MVAQIIHCTVLELPDVNEPIRRLTKPLALRELLPWADPYITSLVERLRREDRRRQIVWSLESGERCEAPPPLDVDAADDDLYFGDWWRQRDDE